MTQHGTSGFLNRRKFLRLCGSLLVVLLPSAVFAVPKCNLTTVTGSYAVAILGQQSGGYRATVFNVTLDGHGNLSGTGAESVNGTISSGVTVTGTYTANTDCWFSSTTTDSLGNVRNLTGAIYLNGVGISGLSTDAGTELHFDFYRLHSTSCAESITGGYYVVKMQSPLTPSGSSIGSQHWHITTKGAATVSSEANIGGTIVSGTGTGTVSVNSDCTYTAIVNNSDGTTSHFFGVIGIGEVDDVAWLILDIDKGWVSLGTAEVLCPRWPIC